MKGRKFGAIKVKQRDDKKSYNHLYYELATKPFIKVKKPLTTRTMFKCPFCSALQFPDKFEKLSKIDVVVRFFLGRANIKHRNVNNDHEIYREKRKNFIIHMIHRAKQFILLYGEKKDLLEVELLCQAKNINPSRNLTSARNSINGASALNGTPSVVTLPSLASQQRLRDVPRA